MAASCWASRSHPDPETLKNPPPFSPFPLIQLRAGKVKKALAGGRIESAIFKSPLSGPVRITKGGIESDEHAFEPHRSPEKAILHYCATHYTDWKRELPASAHLFKPGAFGENLFSAEVSERTICIGDRLSIGSVIVEVSEPRMPCYKLNHRFETKDMAKRTQTLFRTGWLYRVIQPGIAVAGDMIRLLARPFPEWSVARVMYYLFIETNNVDRMKQIVTLGPLGADIKGKFVTRLAKGVTEDQKGRMFGGEDEKMDTWGDYRLVDRRKETSRVTAFSFEAVDKANAMAVEPGSHVRLKLGGNLVRAYSVIGGTSNRFELGIALDPQSRGGSRYIHDSVKVGDVVTVSRITTSFPLAQDAQEHVIIAGGVGITAFLLALEVLQKAKQNFHLHYAVADEVPFMSRISALGSCATIYRKSHGQRMNIASIVAHVGSHTHIYTCGPPGMLDDVKATARSYKIEDSFVHAEAFTIAVSGDPFLAELKQSKKTIEVGAKESLLDALKAAGLDIDSSCEVGNCGTCKVEVCGGRVEHRGTGLVDDEKGSTMLNVCYPRLQIGSAEYEVAANLP